MKYTCQNMHLCTQIHTHNIYKYIFSQNKARERENLKPERAHDQTDVWYTTFAQRGIHTQKSNRNYIHL